MRKFSSYGTIDTDLHYYAPRKKLLEQIYRQLIGEDPAKGGHYITAWGPRQTGKTWLMQQALFRLQQDERFDVAKINLQSIDLERDIGSVIGYISVQLGKDLAKPVARLDTPEAAVYHFNLYKYLVEFLGSYGGEIYPEFPTGNGQIDLVIKYSGLLYGIEVKRFMHLRQYKESLKQAARYGQQLSLTEVTLALFIEAVDDDNRKKYEVMYVDEASGVTVKPVFVEIGSRA